MLVCLLLHASWGPTRKALAPILTYPGVSYCEEWLSVSAGCWNELVSLLLLKVVLFVLCCRYFTLTPHLKWVVESHSTWFMLPKISAIRVSASMCAVACLFRSYTQGFCSQLWQLWEFNCDFCQERWFRVVWCTGLYYFLLELVSLVLPMGGPQLFSFPSPLLFHPRPVRWWGWNMVCGGGVRVSARSSFVSVHPLTLVCFIFWLWFVTFVHITMWA